MCGFLGITPGESNDYFIENFIPEPFNRFHKRNLGGYIERGLSQYIFSEVELFLRDKNGFLVECILNIDCIGYGLKPYFIVIAEPINLWKREMALTDENGFIYAHSKQFPKSIGQNKYELEESNLLNFFSMDTLAACESEKCVFLDLYSVDQNYYFKVCLWMKNLTINSTTLYFFYVAYDPIEVEVIRKLKHDNKYVEINRQTLIVLSKNIGVFKKELKKLQNNLIKEENKDQSEFPLIKQEKIFSEAEDKILLSNKNLIKNIDVIYEAHNPPINHTGLRLRNNFYEAGKSLKVLKFIGFFSVIFN